MTNQAKYIHTTKMHNTKAAEAFIPLLFKTVEIPHSVVDVGCGTGTWLRVFKESGVKKILGIDGDYVNLDLLHIDKSEFLTHDLSKPLILGKKFDLALCLEVAEHLPENSAEVLVDSLCNSSQRILFSAALPCQGGQNHLNEQSIEYWKNKFNNNGYLVKDIFRQEIWDDKRIEWWYRQNMFLIEKISDRKVIQGKINDYYHPDMYVPHSKKYLVISTECKKIKQGEISLILMLKIMAKSIIFNIKKLF
jgi:SAM-dependent methyltransferase